MILVDGKKIRDELKQELKREVGFLALRPRLALVLVGNDPASRKFVSLKKAFAEEIGVECTLHEFPEASSTEELLAAVAELNKEPRVNGIVVQLPLPAQIDTDAVISAVHPAKDADALLALGEESRVPPPVAGAIAEILERYDVSLEGKRAVVIGYGRLVGKPVSQWLVDHGAHLRVIESHTEESIRREALAMADIIISGVGVPGLLKPEMIKTGVVLIDAGTSESSGDRLVGDIDPACAEKASLFTPVPGGVGPITVAIIFKNLLALIARQGAF